MALGMTRAEMLSKMDSAELSEWIAFAGLEPFGTSIDFLGHAITASTLANINRKKGTKAYKPSEFVPKFDKRKQSSDEMLQTAQMFAAAGMGTLDKED